MGIRPLKLRGLSKDATAQMLRGLSQRQAVPESLVSLIFEESQGYPFFVEEVYRHLIEEGKVFDAAGQFRADVEIDEIDVPENVRLIIGKAQHMGIIVASSEGPARPFTFTHELVRQTLLAGISSLRRQHLHAGVADAIARLHQ